MVVPPTALEILRKDLRTRRRTIAKQHKTVLFSMYPILTSLFQNAKTIGIYLPMGGEPDPRPLINGLSAMTSLPALSGNHLMTFRRWYPGDPLIASPWGGQQPSHSAAIVAPDLIVVPLLGFDQAFNRIGQGGGHYDRYLAAHSDSCRVGLAWEAQRVENIDPQPWDVPMDAILTETNFHIRDLARCQRP